MAMCNDPTDQYANIWYFRDIGIIYVSGVFPIEDLAANVQNIRQSFGIAYIITDGPNGQSVYEGSSWDTYIAQGGTPPVGKPVGAIDDQGGISCFGPVPCPTGTHWDLDKNMCVPDNVLEIPPVPAAPPAAPDDPDEQEQIWQITWGYMYWIIQVIQQLTSQTPPTEGGTPSECCTQVVAAIAGVTKAITAITENLSFLNGSGPVLDIAPIVTELECLCTALTTIAGAPPIDLTPLTDALNAINTTLENRPPFDQTNLAKLADDPVGLAAKVQAYLQNLADEGMLSTAELQVITTPP